MNREARPIDTGYNNEYITEKVIKAVKSVKFVRATMRTLPSWITNEPNPIREELENAQKQIQIILDHMDARDKAAQLASEGDSPVKEQKGLYPHKGYTHPRFRLEDDGTLDTVIINTKTGESHRFNYQESGHEGDYDSFVDACIDELDAEIPDPMSEADAWKVIKEALDIAMMSHAVSPQLMEAISTFDEKYSE